MEPTRRQKSYSETAKSSPGNVSSSSDFSRSSSQSNAGSLIGQQGSICGEGMVCHSTSQQCTTGQCPVIGNPGSAFSGQQSSQIGSSSAQMSRQSSGFGSSGIQSGQIRHDLGPQQVSSSISRGQTEHKVKGVTNIDTEMASVPVPTNVHLQSTEFKTQSVNSGLQQMQQPLISKPIVPEQRYVHTMQSQPQVVEVMPAQNVEVKQKTVNISDHGLQNKMLQSAQGLNEYMNCLQNEANLLAMEKANKQVLEQTKERIVDTSRARHELDKQASLREAEAIHKLREAEASAKQMFSDAKMQVKHLEEQQKQGIVTERISEVRTKDKCQRC